MLGAAVAVVRAVPLLWSVPITAARRRRGTLSFVAAALAGRRVRVPAAPLAGLVVATAAATFAARVEAIPDPATIVLDHGAEVSLPAGIAAEAAAADLPTASVIAGEYGPGYVVLPADRMGAKALQPDAVWITGHPDVKALCSSPGVRPSFPFGSYAQVSAAGYADGRTSAAHAVLRMAELLTVGFGVLCLVQTTAGSRRAAHDSALLLRVLGLSETGGRLLGPAVTLPLSILAAAGGLATGAALAPLLGDQVPGAPNDGWLVPVIGVVALCVVGGVGLEAAPRPRQQVSVRLRAAEFE